MGRCLRPLQPQLRYIRNLTTRRVEGDHCWKTAAYLFPVAALQQPPGMDFPVVDVSRWITRVTCGQFNASARNGPNAPSPHNTRSMPRAWTSLATCSGIPGRGRRLRSATRCSARSTPSARLLRRTDSASCPPTASAVNWQSTYLFKRSPHSSAALLAKRSFRTPAGFHLGRRANY
jgi:hypothetical protein